MSYFTMNNRELSRTIRKELKSAGFTSKDVSVKVRSVLYDKAVDITVKNPFVRISEVEEVVKKFSEVEYDERTKEILAGCNVYVHCQYENGIFNDVSAPFIPIAQKVFGSEEWSGRKIAENDNTEVHIIKMDPVESRLYEFDKAEEYQSFIGGYIVRSVEGLAVAMWRFKHLGTIYG